VIMTNKIKKTSKSHFFFVCSLSNFYFTIILLLIIVMSEKKMIGYECYICETESHLIIKCGYVYLEIN
jgi:hypothetical protein